jgi:hypothetical protein
MKLQSHRLTIQIAGSDADLVKGLETLHAVSQGLVSAEADLSRACDDVAAKQAALVAAETSAARVAEDVRAGRVAVARLESVSQEVRTTALLSRAAEARVDDCRAAVKRARDYAKGLALDEAKRRIELLLESERALVAAMDRVHEQIDVIAGQLYQLGRADDGATKGLTPSNYDLRGTFRDLPARAGMVIDRWRWNSSHHG